jgi:hypothetical protein
LFTGSAVSKQIFTVPVGLRWTNREGDFGGLEPYDGKLSRTVLRGGGGREAPRLPGDERKAMKKTIIILLFMSLLLPISCLAGGKMPETLEEQLATDNPRVIKYLQSLKASDTGKKLKGIKLSDNSVALKDHIFLEKIELNKRRTSIYILRSMGQVISYAWVESDGQPLPIPPCPPNADEEGQNVLSGDVYTWKDVQPGDGVVVMKCVTNKWIREVKGLK